MKLRPKLALTLAAVVVPIMIAFTVFRIQAERRAFQERIANRVAVRAEGRGLRRCLRAPEHFHHRARRGFDIYAYGPDFSAANPDAPPFPADLADQLVDADGPLSERLWRNERFSGVTAMRTEAADTPCAVVAIYWPDELSGRTRGLVKNVATQTGVAFLVLLVTGLLVAGPLVRRIRKLTDAVENSGPKSPRVDVEAETNDELGELARAFNSAGERVELTLAELEARDRALKEYVANTTHDLAIPLTVLQHRLRKLQKQLADGSDTRDLADSAMEEAHYVASLVSNMGAAARLEGDEEQLTRHDFRLDELVERVAARHRPLADQKEIELNWAVPEEPIEVHADSTLVEQALSNFVQNAVQYNAAGGHVSVVLERHGDGFELRVLDDGPGLPDELLDNITQRAFRADEARTRNPGGQGFGLAIASRVCELHGWGLAFRNREEGGLEVVVRGQTAEGAVDPGKALT